MKDEIREAVKEVLIAAASLLVGDPDMKVDRNKARDALDRMDDYYLEQLFCELCERPELGFDKADLVLSVVQRVKER